MKTLYADLLLQKMALDPEGTLSQRLYKAIRSAILQYSFNANTRLPSSRNLAKELNVSRNTILAAYEQLIIEGYLYSRTGKGTFVIDGLPDQYLSAQSNITTARTATQVLALSKRGQALLTHAFAAPVQSGAFMPGVPDVTAFPHQRFGKIQSRISRSPNAQLLTYSIEGDADQLRLALANHLKVTRSIQCVPEQILITEGTHQSVDLITKIACDVNDLAWIEEPSYWGIRNVLRINGILMKPIAVDQEGMSADFSPDDRMPKLIFVTPSHQYPLGIIMSLTRRKQLIGLARHCQSWIIEDDYDSEFRFSGQPIPALYSLEDNAPVIYLGTFSKTIYPALRISYMVLPKSLVSTFKAAHAELYRGGRLLIQATLAEFMHTGFYAAHIRAMRLLYGRRRAQLIQLIRDNLGDQYINLSANNAGLHLILELPDGANDVAISEEIMQHGIITRPLSRYYLNSASKRGLLLGYACVPEAIMPEAVSVIVMCLKTHI